MYFFPCRNKAKKLFGKAGEPPPDNPRLHNKQKWDLDDQEQWIQQDQIAQKQYFTDKTENVTLSQKAHEDDWYTAALLRSAQLAELAKQEQADHDQWVDQGQKSESNNMSSQAKLRHRAPLARKAPPEEDWFSIALQQSAQLDNTRLLQPVT